MPYTYHKDPERDHGTAHHVFLNVDMEADQTEVWRCACGDKGVITLGLVPVMETTDAESMAEWLDREEVALKCADAARHKLGIEPDVTAVEGINRSKRHYLREEGLDSIRDLRAMTAEELSKVDGFDLCLARIIKNEVGSYQDEDAAYNSTLTSWGGA